jgi:hypothetical protein
MKRSILSRLRPKWQSEFDHHYCCWAINHGGWRKMKKQNRRLAKRKLKREVDDENA